MYRATDTTLGRQAALKVLPESLASDTERIARFEREAKTLASLNHPNIAQIYGFEKSSGVHALLMELVEGPTLGERIDVQRGPLRSASLQAGHDGPPHTREASAGCLPIDEAWRSQGRLPRRSMLSTSDAAVPARGSGSACLRTAAPEGG